MNKKSLNHYQCDFPRADEKILGGGKEGEGGRGRNEAHYRVPGEDQAKKFENY